MSGDRRIANQKKEEMGNTRTMVKGKCKEKNVEKIRDEEFKEERKKIQEIKKRKEDQMRWTERKLRRR